VYSDAISLFAKTTVKSTVILVAFWNFNVPPIEVFSSLSLWVIPTKGNEHACAIAAPVPAGTANRFTLGTDESRNKTPLIPVPFMFMFIVTPASTLIVSPSDREILPIIIDMAFAPVENGSSVIILPFDVSKCVLLMDGYGPHPPAPPGKPLAYVTIKVNTNKFVAQKIILF
jgi:hypothetical protein